MAKKEEWCWQAIVAFILSLIFSIGGGPVLATICFLPALGFAAAAASATKKNPKLKGQFLALIAVLLPIIVYVLKLLFIK